MIFVSKSLDYALRSLIYLAQSPGKVVSLKELARSVHVPTGYLAKVMRLLVRSGIVHSDAGMRGGYRLNRSPEAISIREVYEVVEGELRAVECLHNPYLCELSSSCTQISLWNDLEAELRAVLGKRSLKDCLPSPPFIPTTHLQHPGKQKSPGTASSREAPPEPA